MPPLRSPLASFVASGLLPSLSRAYPVRTVHHTIFLATLRLQMAPDDARR